MRQPLKELNEMFEPDARSTGFGRYDAAGRHTKTIQDHYTDIRAIELSDGVPETIRDEFDTIRNLYLYAWYVYDFTVPATLYACALTEKAIREKYARSGLPPKEHPGLSSLLKTCIDRGWLTNAAFPFALEWVDEDLVSPGSNSDMPGVRSKARYLPGGTNYCEKLARALPKIRNAGAHGEAGLDFPQSALGIIEICACIVNALFPATGGTADQSGRGR
ncbi:MAG: hypothetical protein OXC14_02790 [Rhodospirillaceae bacterium]|nr:hypothetical protein [Rhodospirillaceae bacterium]